MSDTPKIPAHVPLPTKPRNLFSTVRASRSNVLSIVPKITTTDDIVTGGTYRRWHMVMEPEALRRILIENVDNYPKSNVTQAVLRPAIGDSLFVVHGPEWRWQRRTTAPAFSRRNVHALSRFATVSAGRICERISGATGPVNMHSELVRTTFDVITDVTFSGEADFDVDHLHKLFDRYVESVGKSALFEMLNAPNWIPRPGRRKLRKSLTEMHRIVDDLISARAEQKIEGADLLGLLLGAEDPESGRRMTQKELRDNLLTFIMAGHETTALALSWALYLCAFDESVQDRARAEAQAVLNGRVAEADDLSSLTYIRQVMEETLRLYPSASLVSRTAQKNDELCGRRILRNDTVIIPIYSIQRHEKYWDRPDEFNPDRFADRKKIKRFTYLPFGDGPRVCIGSSFAVDEAVIILASLLSRYRFQAVQGRTPQPMLVLTLRPKGGVWLKVTPVE